MSLRLQQQIAYKGILGLWTIEEDEPWFLDKMQLTTEEQKQLNGMRGRRRLEWLSARMLVHELSGREERAHLVKDEFGKPYIKDSTHHISISHSGKLAAVVAAPCVVGIDIQLLVPKLERLMHKYMNAEEINGLEEHHKLQQLHVYWGAKEALYKAYGRRALDFCTNIKVTPFQYDSKGGETQGVIIKDDYYVEFKVIYKMIETHMLVYVLAKEKSST
ncbi:MAG: 4'-phosphopantetheinyl transferase superfamily protein [Chitinophagales bacterium]|nr:4'-phosphopantetheinyl transferase superfamily protein [Chitinophagales bacterium]